MKIAFTIFCVVHFVLINSTSITSVLPDSKMFFYSPKKFDAATWLLAY